MKQTFISRALSAADTKIQYDEHVKNLLADKLILAHILKNTVAEVSELDIQQIITCIGDDIEISQTMVNPGETNRPEKVTGDDTESNIPYEGQIRYDLRFHLRIPNVRNTQIKLLINLEAQKDFHKPYDFVTRGIFYGARMISAQLDTEFTHSNYQNLKKVYSIWICMNAPDAIGNALTQYSFSKKDIIGIIPDNPENYDKLCVILIYLNRKASTSSAGVIELLNTLLSPDIKQKQKEIILKEHYNIDTNITGNIGKELKEMCNLSEAIEEKGILKGKIEGKIEAYRELGLSKEVALEKLCEKFSFTLNEAKEQLEKYWK